MDLPECDCELDIDVNATINIVNVWCLGDYLEKYSIRHN